MTKRNWKRIQPTGLRNAMELCKDYARERRNLSVERIAELMGLADHWTLYKWIQSGRMPVNMIRPFEQACGIDFVTRWIAASAGKLLIDMPTGRASNAGDINTLQALLNDALGKLIDFYADKREADETLTAIQHAMEGLAFQRANVKKHSQPELELGDADV